VTHAVRSVSAVPNLSPCWKRRETMGAGEDHEADGGGDGEEEDEAEGFLEDVLEVFLRRGEEGEDDGGDGVADEGEGELGELVAVVEDRDGAVAGDEVLGDEAADELVDLDGGEARR
jgi:hypothetical protein